MPIPPLPHSSQPADKLTHAANSAASSTSKLAATLPADEVSDSDSLPPRPLSHHLALTIYWLSNSLLWGALLHLGLQSRLSLWFGPTEVGYYLGLSGAVGGIVATVLQIVMGALSDRSLHPWGRRRPFVLAGSLVAVGALLLLGASQSFWPFVGALLLLQAGTNTALGPFAALLPDTVNPREHGKASGFMGVARLLGDIGGLVLAAHLLSAGHLGEASPVTLAAFHNHRFGLMCLIMAGFMVVSVVASLFLLREKPLTTRPLMTPWQIIRTSFQIDVSATRDFLWLSLSRAITNLGFYIFLMVLYFYLRYSLAIEDAEKASLQVMLPAIAAAVISSVPAGMLSDRSGRRRLIYLSQFLMTAAAVVFVFAPTVTWVYIAGVPAGLAFGVFTAVEWALACNLLPAGEKARYLGIWNASAVVPQILAFPVAGAIGSALATLANPGLGWRVDFALTVVLCLAGAYVLRFVHERPAAGNWGTEGGPESC